MMFKSLFVFLAGLSLTPILLFIGHVSAIMTVLDHVPIIKIFINKYTVRGRIKTRLIPLLDSLSPANPTSQDIQQLITIVTEISSSHCFNKNNLEKFITNTRHFIDWATMYINKPSSLDAINDYCKVLGRVKAFLSNN